MEDCILPPYELHFKHDPLPAPSEYIRLLEVTQASLGQQAVTYLSTWPTSRHPPYHAVSYTWGPPEPLRTITVNDQHFQIRTNCEYVLQQIVHSQAGRFYWIDAICIDQTNINEKNHQVALMSKIYQNAEHVLACIGEHESDSHYLFEACESKQKILVEIRTACGGLQWINSPWAMKLPSLDPALELKCSLAFSMSARTRLRKAFVAFLKRSYFTRVWIIQELCMGKKVSFLCGHDRVSADLLAAIDAILCTYADERLSSYGRMELHKKAGAKATIRLSNLMGRTESAADASQDLQSIRPAQGCLTLAAGGPKVLRLTTLLENMISFGCTDRRDKIYGILAIVSWVPDALPGIDYGRDVAELAFQTLCAVAGLESGKLRQTSRPLLSWVQRIFTMFEVTSDEFEAAVRSGAIEEIAKLHEENTGDPRGTMVDRRARPILSLTGSHKIKPQSLYLAQKSGNLSTLQLGNKDIYADIPADTRTGDWFVPLYEDLNDYFASPYGLVIRYVADKLWAIIGLCVVHENVRRKCDWKGTGYGVFADDFMLQWDLVDAAGFYYATQNSALTSQQIIELPLCRPDTLSFVRGEVPTWWNQTS